MSSLKLWPLSLSGHVLVGDRWVKQIHIDEAGTSRKEPKAVVAGVIVDGDVHFRKAEEAIAKAIADHIPAHLQDGFVFHAKDVFGKHRKSEDWSLEKCYEITEAWLAIMADLRIPWVVSFWSKHDLQNGKFESSENKISHLMAFVSCFQASDKLVAHISPSDVASVIAEDCTEMKTLLKEVIRIRVSGELGSEFFKRPITHIKNAVQFCDKEDAVLLQLADVCAYSFKRYVTGSPGGDRLFKAMLGGELLKPTPHPRTTAAGHMTWDWVESRLSDRG